ncbi:putative ubiquitin-like modifier 1 [Rosellinia necatrix]|uniref:Ubiquitin-related modifier 1 n=1 Tax=Rosellinia necatrix TaxID=77044 RepID=A0A1W2TLB3_ROSNE|nr:putative ubiquitin-like modifier 1 [Rosellinia necatrix]
MAAVTTTTTITADTAAVDISPRAGNARQLSVVVEFTGGLEMLFSDQRRHELSIPAIDKNDKPVTIAYLIQYLCENTMNDTRQDLFILDDHLRPGILVLINDADWELEGEETYEIQNRDNILFVSTLHGG